MAKRIISNADFVHLHVHSSYSSFDGVNSISSLPLLARKMGFQSIALTDHGNIGGIYKFMMECYKEKDVPYPVINPILGCEFYLSKNHNIHFSTKKSGKKVIEVGQEDGRKGNRHLILLAKNFTGYQNLCRLSNASWTEGYFHDPRIDLHLLNKYHEGLICTTACLSSVVNANLLHDRYDQAKKSAQIFKDIFGEDFYLEAMYHGMDAEGRIIPDIIKLGQELDTKVVCTNDVHYGTHDQGSSHEVLMCMSTSRCITDPKHLHFPYHEFYLKSAKEMSIAFGSHPEMLLNTVEVASKVNSKDILQGMTSGMRLPKYKVPDGFSGPFDYLKHIATEGMKKLGWNNSKPHIERFNMEINDIKIAWDNSRLDFATYLLVVYDYIAEAKKRGILTGAGRGSGYGSILLRCLGITYGPDPLAYGLLWQRFLGFDDQFFITPQDLGLDAESLSAPIISTEVDDARSYEDDMGGVDRY